MGVRYPINVPERCPFTLQNIPFGIFSLEDTQDQEVRWLVSFVRDKELIKR